MSVEARFRLVLQGGEASYHHRRDKEGGGATLPVPQDPQVDLFLARLGISCEQCPSSSARVQRSSFPDCFPEIRGLRIDSLYRPCQAIGGDYLDFVRQNGETWILISDVSGHGVEAALINMLMKGIFQDTAPGAEDPSQLFAEINARLNRFLPEGTYAAATVLCVDEQNATVHLVNAGLPYLFGLRSWEQRLDEVVLPGIPLGMFFGAGLDAYEVRRIEMMPGDVLLVAVDGLSEMQAENGEFFGDRQLCQILMDLNGSGGKELVSNLVERAGRFRGSQRPMDDIAIVALTRTSQTDPPLVL